MDTNLAGPLDAQVLARGSVALLPPQDHNIVHAPTLSLETHGQCLHRVV